MEPEVRLERISFFYPETETLVFRDLSLDLPPGAVTLVGQNGTGKSTLLLLAAGLLLPSEGNVLLHGIDTRTFREETERQRHVSFVYQNMEFETEETIGDLLAFVYEHGFHERQDPQLVSDLVRVCELGPVLAKRTQEVSKGELQRTIIAFSLLYGSRIVMMDEPIFALEEPQKHRVMGFLLEYIRGRGSSLYYSVHELDISEKYSDWLLLFHRDRPPQLGPTRELFNRENIEYAYEVPFTMLRTKESLYRKILLERTRPRGQA
jgi:ABC-type cobalamin/Fe3+-siderophores transport system ATPase subunit